MSKGLYLLLATSVLQLIDHSISLPNFRVSKSSNIGHDFSKDDSSRSHIDTGMLVLSPKTRELMRSKNYPKDKTPIFGRKKPDISKSIFAERNNSMKNALNMLLNMTNVTPQTNVKVKHANKKVETKRKRKIRPSTKSPVQENKLLTNFLRNSLPEHFIKNSNIVLLKSSDEAEKSKGTYVHSSNITTIRPAQISVLPSLNNQVAEQGDKVVIFNETDSAELFLDALETAIDSYKKTAKDVVRPSPEWVTNDSVAKKKSRTGIVEIKTEVKEPKKEKGFLQKLTESWKLPSWSDLWPSGKSAKKAPESATMTPPMARPLAENILPIFYKGQSFFSNIRKAEPTNVLHKIKDFFVPKETEVLEVKTPYQSASPTYKVKGIPQLGVPGVIAAIGAFALGAYLAPWNGARRRTDDFYSMRRDSYEQPMVFEPTVQDKRHSAQDEFRPSELLYMGVETSKNDQSQLEYPDYQYSTSKFDNYEDDLPYKTSRRRKYTKSKNPHSSLKTLKPSDGDSMRSKAHENLRDWASVNPVYSSFPVEGSYSVVKTNPKSLPKENNRKKYSFWKENPRQDDYITLRQLNEMADKSVKTLYRTNRIPFPTKDFRGKQLRDPYQSFSPSDPMPEIQNWKPALDKPKFLASIATTPKVLTQESETKNSESSGNI